MEWWKFVIVILISYLIGNISNARFISRTLKKDITKQGSGNPGTMNMLRTFGFGVGLFTLVLDAIKGAIPALIGYLLFGADGSLNSYIGLYVAGLAVVVGHNFPVFYKFKGGKGVACILGVYAVAQPLWVAIAFVICFIYLLIFDYGAIASFIFITTLTVIEAYRFSNSLTICLLLFSMFFLTWFMHRQNIFRLLIGKENKANVISALKKLGKKEKRIARKEQKQENKEREIG
ncbi:MAG: glycerol-3-phosphate acyltransferase [Clostridia bacterium]